MTPVQLILKSTFRRISPGLAAACMAILLAGCATLQQSREAELGPHHLIPVLPDDGVLYLYVRGPDARQFLTDFAEAQGIDRRQTALILDRLDAIYASVSRPDGNSISWTVAGEGAFPVIPASWALDIESAWRRTVAGQRRWTEQSSGYQVALPDARHVFLDSTDLSPVLTRWEGIQERGTRMLTAPPVAAFSGLVTEYGTSNDIVAFAGEISKLPLVGSALPPGTSLEITGVFNDDTLSVDLELVFDTQAKARVGALFIRMLLLAERKQKEEGLWAGAEVAVDETRVRLGPVTLDAETIGNLITVNAIDPDSPAESSGGKS